MMPLKRLTVLICTHNRKELLQNVLTSLNRARRPTGWEVGIFVAANACDDGTHELLESYVVAAADRGWLPLEWMAEPIPGKSYALNSAIRAIGGQLVAFVDDDHRVDAAYLAAVCEAADEFQEASMFCGRILPDWDGTEPDWVHDEGPYRIRPLPVPRSDGGEAPKRLSADDPTPGGGNLFLRREVLDRVGGFPTDLGPRGHDLGGGEDTVFLDDAMNRGEILQYVPTVVQFHYVDPRRLRLGYVLRKAYQRSRSVIRARASGDRVPKYAWRKLVQHLAKAMFSLNWSKTRYFLVRAATTLGEIRGMRARLPHGPPPSTVDRRRNQAYLAGLALTAILGLAMVPQPARPALATAAGAAFLPAAVFTLLLAVKSVRDRSQGGPRIRNEIRRHYWPYVWWAFGRLLGFAFAILAGLALTGVILYAAANGLAGRAFSFGEATAAAVCSILVLTGLQFCRHLLHIPASVAASSHYRMSRFYPLWRTLTPSRLRVLSYGLSVAAAGVLAAAAVHPASAGNWPWLASLGATAACYAGLALWFRGPAEPRPVTARPRAEGRPNILMIGSDTLRSDRLAEGYPRRLTPFIEQLAQRGTLFGHCYVPCARTAPSLISLLTGVWPHNHGIRDNFAADSNTDLPVEALPTILRRHGYFTAALSDWCGADMGKYSFGFEYLDVPEDQWNFKLFIRQGPKDLRLFLSLFTHNPVGKFLLPEIHYLGGIPLTDELGRESRRLLNYLGRGDRPFFLNLFLSTTHGPFGSEYPYYTRFSDPDYRGESKFVMARVADPFEIIRRQGEPKEEFDLDQILNLYDGCVSRFDDEVARIVAHLERCGLADNTVIVLYSDHGMEFFEHGTWGQGNSAVGEASTRVPLLVLDPRRPRKERSSRVVRSIDLAPTLLDIAGLPPHPAMDGVSLSSCLQGSDLPQELTAYNETGIWLTDLPGMPPGHLRYPNLVELLEIPDKESGTLAVKAEYADLVVAARDRMVRRGRWKLVYQPLTEGYLLKLFDVEADPMCTANLIRQHGDVAAALWGHLQRLMRADSAWLRFQASGNEERPVVMSHS